MDECKALVEDFVREVHALYPDTARDDDRPTVTFVGRGLHSSTTQVNLSHFRHKIHPKYP